MKILITVIVSVVATLGALFGIGMAFRGGGLVGPQPQPTAVRVEPSVRGALVEVVSIPGEIQPETKVQIGARVSAQILDLPHKEGDRVTGFDPKAAGPTSKPARSSILVELDARDLQSALKSAEERSAAQEAEVEVYKARIESQRATIAASEATLADAERELKRQEQLYVTRDVAEQAVDQARTKASELRNQLAAARHSLAADEQNLTVLRHTIEASKAETNRAREQLAYTVITSPIDGTVIKVNSKVGENVVPGIQGSAGSVILEVADLSRMLMIGRVDEAAVAMVKKGQPATVRMQAYRDRVFKGTVLSVGLSKADLTGRGAQARSASADGANYYEARILLETNGEPIFSGLNADADIEIRRHEGVKVPSQAVLGRPVESLPEDLRKQAEALEKGKQFASVVYRHADGKAVATPVKVGPSDETHTLVLSGLNEGEPVIVGPYKNLDALQHDQKVKADGPPAAGAGTRPAETRPAGTQPTTGPAASPTETQPTAAVGKQP